MNSIKTLSVALSALILASCGSNDSTRISPQSSVDLTFAKGPVQGAVCTIGDATQTTGANGTATFNNVDSGNIIASCIGGSYTDESSGETLTIASAQTAIIPSGGSNIVISPLTTAAFNALSEQTDPNTANTSDITTANTRIANLFGLDGVEIATMAPAFTSDNDMNALYGAALYIISEAADGSATTLSSIIDDISNGNIMGAGIVEAAENVRNQAPTLTLHTYVIESNSGMDASGIDIANATASQLFILGVADASFPERSAISYSATVSANLKDATFSISDDSEFSLSAGVLTFSLAANENDFETTQVYTTILTAATANQTVSKQVNIFVINVADSPPILSTPTNLAAYVTGEQIAPLVISNTASDGDATSCSTSLSGHGLTISAVRGDCLISGTPNSAQADGGSETVSAINDFGSNTISFSIIINRGDATIEAGADRAATYTDGGTLAAQVPTNGLDRTISYQSSDTDVAEVNPNSGVITIRSIGTTRITITATQSTNYNSAEDSYLLTIRRADQSNFNLGANEQSIGLLRGTYQVSPSGNPSGTTISDYSSSNTDIATVGDSGEVTLLALGSTTISAVSRGDNYNDAEASFILTVVDRFTIAPTSPIAAYGNGPITFTTIGGVGATTSFTSGDETVATIDSDGVATIINAGTSLITATSDSDEATSVLTVNQVSLGVTVISEGAALSLPNPSAPNSDSNRYTFTYSGDQQDITFAVDGEVAGDDINPSNTDINGDNRATNAGDYSFEIALRDNSDNHRRNYNFATGGDDFAIYWQILRAEQSALSADVPTTLSNNNSFTISVGGASLTSSTTAPIASLTFTSADTAVATINNNGAINALALGFTTITIESPENLNYLTETISYPLEVVNLPPVANVQPNRNLSIANDITIDLSSEFSDPNGDDLTFSTANTDGRISLDATSGIISVQATAFNAGDSIAITIIASDGLESVTASINLSFLEGLALSPEDPIATYGDGTFDFTTSGGSEASTDISSSDLTVATIDNSGVATIIGAGTSVITATNGGDEATSLLTVNQRPLGVTITSGGTALSLPDTNQPNSDSNRYGITYDGTQQTIAFMINNVVAGDNVMDDVTISGGSQATDAGDYSATITLTNDDHIRNYNFATGGDDFAIYWQILRAEQSALSADVPATLSNNNSVTISVSGASLTSSTAAPIASLIFTSADTAVATIDDSGTINALTLGFTTITIESPENLNYLIATYSDRLEVVNLTPTADEIPDRALLITNDITIDLSPYFSDPNDDDLTFSTDNTDGRISLEATSGIISVEATAFSAGDSITITITASDGLEDAITSINLSFAEGLAISPINPSVTYGDGAITFMADGGVGDASFTSSDGTVATIDDSGVATIIGAGTSVITATDGDNVAISTLTVNQRSLTVTITSEGVALPLPDTNQPNSDSNRYSFTYDGNQQTIAFMINNDVAGDNVMGDVTTSGDSQATDAGDYSAMIALTNDAHIRNYNFATGGDDFAIYWQILRAEQSALSADVPATLSNNNSVTISVSGASLTSSATATIASLTFTSSDTAVATIDENGTINALTVGFTTITIESPENLNYLIATYSDRLEVVNLAPTADEIPDRVLSTTDDITIALSPYFSDPNDDDLTFSTDNTDSEISLEATSGIISVEATAFSAGDSITITITASDGLESVTASINLSFVAGFSISPPMLVETYGDASPTISVVGSMEGTTGETTFSIDDTSIATIDATNGMTVLNIISIGTTTIRATRGIESATASLVVRRRVLEASLTTPLTFGFDNAPHFVDATLSGGVIDLIQISPEATNSQTDIGNYQTTFTISGSGVDNYELRGHIAADPHSVVISWAIVRGSQDFSIDSPTSLMFGQTSVIEIIGDIIGDRMFSSDNTNVATIIFSGGIATVRASGIGTATISLFASGSDNIDPATESYVLTVTKNEQSDFAFNPSALIISPQSSINLDSLIVGKLSSGPTNYAVIEGGDFVNLNVSTLTTANSIGSALVEATSPEDDNYSEATAVLDITIAEQSAGVDNPYISALSNQASIHWENQRGDVNIYLTSSATCTIGVNCISDHRESFVTTVASGTVLPVAATMINNSNFFLTRGNYLVLQFSDNTEARTLIASSVADSPHWQPRFNHQIVQASNTFYLSGGRQDRDATGHNDVWRSSNGIIWEQIATAPWEARYEHQMVLFNNQLYLMGGLSNDDVYHNDVWRSADGITWTELTASASWSPRSGHRVTVFNDAMYLYGGSVGSVSSSDVWRSTDGVTWRLVAASAAPGSRTFHGLLEFDNSLYVLGGLDGTDTFPAGIWASTNTNGAVIGASWTQVASLSLTGFGDATDTGNFGGSYVVNGDELWLFGGTSFDGNIQRREYEALFQDGTWSVPTNRNPWGQRRFQQVLIFQDYFYLFGGLRQLQEFNDIWRRPIGGTSWEFLLPLNH